MLVLRLFFLIPLTLTGKNASQEFDDQGHSEDAIEMLKKFYVGDMVCMIFSGLLTRFQAVTEKSAEAPKAAAKTTQPKNAGSSMTLPIIILGAVVAAAGYFFLMNH